MRMNHLFKLLPELDSTYYRNYFLNTFIPENKFLEESSFYNEYYNLKLFPEINKFGKYLTEKYRFPELEYMIVFRHARQQSIHADGTANNTRDTSLNLPIRGYEKTKMVWYMPKIGERPIISTAHYYESSQVDKIESVDSTNEWILVNSKIPHNIINSDFTNPRITACLRFKGNPSFMELSNLVDAGRQ